MASITKHDKADAQADEKVFRLEDFPVHEKLEKFMEDVKWVGGSTISGFCFHNLFDRHLFSGMVSTLWLHLPWQCHHPQKPSPQLLSSIGIHWNYPFIRPETRDVTYWSSPRAYLQERFWKSKWAWTSRRGIATCKHYAGLFLKPIKIRLVLTRHSPDYYFDQ